VQSGVVDHRRLACAATPSEQVDVFVPELAAGLGSSRLQEGTDACRRRVQRAHFMCGWKSAIGLAAVEPDYRPSRRADRIVSPALHGLVDDRAADFVPFRSRRELVRVLTHRGIRATLDPRITTKTTVGRTEHFETKLF